MVSNVQVSSGQPAEPQPGYLVEGRFLLREEIGRGKMGAVWKAHDRDGGRDVVLKFHIQAGDIVASGGEETGTSLVACFRRVHALQHQHICPHYLLGSDQRFGAYVVMKYLPGETLTQQIRSSRQASSRMSQIDLVRVLRPVAEGLDYMHREGLVHRDVKPDNLVLMPTGDVQIIDLGLAAPIESIPAGPGAQPSGGKTIAGSMGYLAPEVWRGEQATPRSDQYALATIAYELLAGRRPFDDALTPSELLARTTTCPVPPIPGLSRRVFAVLQKGLSKDPAKRFQSCAAFVRSLIRAIRNSAELDSGRTSSATGTICEGVDTMGPGCGPWPLEADMAATCLALAETVTIAQ